VVSACLRDNRLKSREESLSPCTRLTAPIDWYTGSFADRLLGGKLDFHATRVTYINLVIEAGASVKEAQTLARHATPEMTLNIYGRTRESRLHEVIGQVAQTLERATRVHTAETVKRTQAVNDSYSDTYSLSQSMENTGFEPVTSALQGRRSPI
jgi:hypothetical protein